jgi:hypothetical protein
LFTRWSVRLAESAVGARPPNDGEARPWALGREPDAEEILVVAKLDVVARAMLLDERVLEDRRLLLGRRDDRIEIADGLQKEGNELPLVRAPGLKVASDAAPQALGLAHVDDAPLLVFEEVNARLGRKGVELRLNGLREHLGGR